MPYRPHWTRGRNSQDDTKKGFKAQGEILCHLSESKALAEFGSKVTSKRITDCSYVASYNWLKGDEPTILLPGEYFIP